MQTLACQMSWNGQITEEKVSTGIAWGWNYGMGKPGLNFTLGKYWNGPYFIGPKLDQVMKHSFL